MKFFVTILSLASLGLAAPALEMADNLSAPTNATETADKRGHWEHNIGNKKWSGSGSHGCVNYVLRQGTQWRWRQEGSCTLRMYGSSGCTQNTRLYFQTNKRDDHGAARTDHQAWDVRC